jgi:hypothetical protein
LLSLTFHRRLLGLLSGRAIIESVKPRALLLAPSLAGLVGLSLLVSACGGSPGSHVAQLGSTTTTTQSSPSSTASSAPPQQKARASLLAYSQCMRSHGVANFPDPDAQGQFPPFHSDSAASKQASLSANDACKSLLRSGGMGTPQERQTKFAFALKVARCLRAHGYPNFPDPTVSSQGTSQNLSGAGIDPSAPQFQAAEMACEKQARKALGLS